MRSRQLPQRGHTPARDVLRADGAEAHRRPSRRRHPAAEGTFEERDDLRISAASARKSRPAPARRARLHCRQLCRRLIDCRAKTGRRYTFIRRRSVDGLCSEAVGSCFSVLSFDSEGLSEGAAPVFQEGSTVLARRFALGVCLPSRSLPFFSPTPEPLWRLPLAACAIVAARSTCNNDPCPQLHYPKDPHSTRRSIGEQPRVDVRSALGCVGRRAA